NQAGAARAVGHASGQRLAHAGFEGVARGLLPAPAVLADDAPGRVGRVLEADRAVISERASAECNYRQKRKKDSTTPSCARHAAVSSGRGPFAWRSLSVA